MPPQDSKNGTVDPSGRYRLLRKLGSGGMAEVHLAVMRGEAGFEKQVVVKRILPQFSRDAEFVQRLIREGRIVALMNHGNIVQVLELGQWDGEYFLSMEHVDGCDLRQLEEQLARAPKPFPVGPAIQVLLAVARALDYAHSLTDREGRPLGVVHRDISPANVLISRHGEVKLADFGIARWEDEESLRTATGHLRGKLPYISPEQVEGRQPDFRSDLFSFGVLAYELLSSGRPFDGDTTLRTLENIRQVRHKPLTLSQPQLDPELSALVESCLELDPARRPPAASELVRVLEAVAGRGAGAASSELARLVADCLALAPVPREDPLCSGRNTESVVVKVPRRPAHWALAILLVALGLGGLALTLKLVLDWHSQPPTVTHLPPNPDRKGGGGPEANPPSPTVTDLPPNPDRKGGGRPEGPQGADRKGGGRPEGPQGADRKGGGGPAGPVGGLLGAPVPPAKPAPVPASSVAPAPASAPLVPALVPPVPALLPPAPPSPAPAEPAPEAPAEPAPEPPAEAQEAPTAVDDAQEARPFSVTRISVVPPGAAILVGGERQGTGEALVRLEEGQTVQVRMEAPGFEPQALELTHPAPRRLHKALQPLATGSLKLRYFPAGAKVWLDGKALAPSGELNIISVSTTPGAHLLRVEAPGGRFVEQGVLVEADQEKGLTVTVE